MMSFLIELILSMIKYITLIALLINLTGCFIFGEPTEFDETTGQSPEWILDRSDALMDQRDYRKAITFLEKLVQRYPDNKIIPQARLNLAYSYYKFGQKELGLSTLNQFITLYPSHPAMDYAYYLNGVLLYEERGIINKITMQDISDRDIAALKKAFDAFNEVTKRYPNSKYFQDSIDRMTYLMNKIAEYDLHVARYYMRRKAYVAAINRAKTLYTSYPESIHTEEALTIQYIGYKELGLKDLEESTKKVINHNFPEATITKNFEKSKAKWWEFWKSLTD